MLRRDERSTPSGASHLRTHDRAVCAVQGAAWTAQTTAPESNAQPAGQSLRPRRTGNESSPHRLQHRPPCRTRGTQPRTRRCRARSALSRRVRGARARRARRRRAPACSRSSTLHRSIRSPTARASCSRISPPRAAAFSAVVVGGRRQRRSRAAYARAAAADRARATPDFDRARRARLLPDPARHRARRRGLRHGRSATARNHGCCR